MIDPEDLDLMQVVDTTEEVCEIFAKLHRRPRCRGRPAVTCADQRAPEPPRYRLLIGDWDATEPLAAFVGDRRTSRGERPWVMINVVESVDGATAVSGESRGLSGPADREVFHALRGVADAILVGAGTVRADSYGPMRPRPGSARPARPAGNRRWPPSW